MVNCEQKCSSLTVKISPFKKHGFQAHSHILNYCKTLKKKL